MGLHCSTELPSEEGPANFTQKHTNTAAPYKQKQLLREMSKPCFETTSNRSWLNHGLFTWIIHGWIVAGCGATGQQDLKRHYSCTPPAKEFSQCFVCCGEAVEIGETEFASLTILELVRVRYKKLSTNQNRGIIWLSQGCSNITLGTRLLFAYSHLLLISTTRDGPFYRCPHDLSGYSQGVALASTGMWSWVQNCSSLLTVKFF